MDGAERLVERHTTVRLEYRNRTDWVKTVLADSVEPAMAGSTQRYTGTELIEDLPDIGSRTLQQNPREVLAPAWWLADWSSAPGYDARDLNQSQREYVLETTETCSSRTLCGQSFGESIVSRERIVVDTATRVPVLVERTLGDLLVLRVEVHDLAPLP